MNVPNFKIYLILSTVFVSSSCDQVISADTRQISHQIATGRGLYTEYDKIALLNASNFKSEVYSNTTSKSWFVEFYSSWCGHCQRFAPIWKALAQDIYGWRNLVNVAAVDCSNPSNTPLCRDYEVMTYPNVRFFPSGSSQTFLGATVGDREINALRHYVIRQLKDESVRKNDLSKIFTGYEGSINNVWKNDASFAVIVIENSSSYLTAELALDLNRVENVKVLSVPEGNENVSLKNEGVYLLSKDSGINDKIGVTNDSHLDLYDKARSILANKGVVLPVLENKKITAVPVSADLIVELIKIDQLVKEKLQRNKINDMVFQVDIEGALRQTLYVEIPSHKLIEGDKLTALKLYLRTLADLFPIGEKGKNFLRCLRDSISVKEEVKGSDFISEVKSCEEGNSPVYMSTGGWIGCRGSEPRFRGYPCALWTMFHTIVVQAYLHTLPDPKQPLRTMKGYITHFFGCTDCSQHFQSMAVTMEGNVTDTNSSILWLWKAHNTVNKRLHNDPTEDPKHPKVQFPPPDVCPECCKTKDIWDEEKVLMFLKNMYTNISYLSLSDIPSSKEIPAIAAKLIRHEVMVDEKMGTEFEKNEIHANWDLNLIDLLLVSLLYLISVIIIGLICIKLCKKYQRKKLNINSWEMSDIFQKV